MNKQKETTANEVQLKEQSINVSITSNVTKDGLNGAFEKVSQSFRHISKSKSDDLVCK